MGSIKTFTDTENNIETYVWRHSTGGFATAMRDLDSGNVVCGMVRIFREDVTPHRAFTASQDMLGIPRIAHEEVPWAISAPWIETDRETAYGATVRLSNSVRVF